MWEDEEKKFSKFKNGLCVWGCRPLHPKTPRTIWQVGVTPYACLKSNTNQKVKMSKEIKPVGMLHIPGKNDKQWKEFLKKNKEKQQVKNNLWYQLP